MGCPCCPERDRGRGKYTWELLDHNCNVIWQKVTTPPDAVFDSNGTPSRWYQHILPWEGNNPGRGVMLTNTGVFSEYIPTDGSTYYVTARAVSDGSIVNQLEFERTNDFVVGRVGADRLLTTHNVALDYLSNPSYYGWRFRLWDGDLNLVFESPVFTQGSDGSLSWTSIMLVHNKHRVFFGVFLGYTSQIDANDFEYKANVYDENGSGGATPVFTGYTSGLPVIPSGSGHTLSWDGEYVAMSLGTVQFGYPVYVLYSVTSGAESAYLAAHGANGIYSTYGAGVSPISPYMLESARIARTGPFVKEVDWAIAPTGKIVHGWPNEVNMFRSNGNVQRWLSGSMSWEVSTSYSWGLSLAALPRYFETPEAGTIIVYMPRSGSAQILILSGGSVVVDSAISTFDVLGGAGLMDANAEYMLLHRG